MLQTSARRRRDEARAVRQEQVEENGRSLFRHWTDGVHALVPGLPSPPSDEAFVTYYLWEHRRGQFTDQARSYVFYVLLIAVVCAGVVSGWRSGKGVLAALAASFCLAVAIATFLFSTTRNFPMPRRMYRQVRRTGVVVALVGVGALIGATRIPEWVPWVVGALAAGLTVVAVLWIADDAADRAVFRLWPLDPQVFVSAALLTAMNQAARGPYWTTQDPFRSEPGNRWTNLGEELMYSSLTLSSIAVSPPAREFPDAHLRAQAAVWCRRVAGGFIELARVLYVGSTSDASRVTQSLAAGYAAMCEGRWEDLAQAEPFEERRDRRTALLARCVLVVALVAGALLGVPAVLDAGPTATSVQGLLLATALLAVTSPRRAMAGLQSDAAVMLRERPGP